MSRTHDGHRISSIFGNPIKFMLRKHASNTTPKILKKFETNLSQRLERLELRRSGSLNLKWIAEAMSVLSEIHLDLRALISDLKFPLSKWDESWMDQYLDDTVYLLDICIALGSERSKLEKSQLFVRYALHLLDFSGDIADDDLGLARVALEDLKGFLKNREASSVSDSQGKIENCAALIHDMGKDIQPRKKGRWSGKAKLLWKAIYGVRVITILVCYALVSAFLKSPVPAVEIPVPDHFLWAASFTSLQQDIKQEIKGWTIDGVEIVLEEVGSLEAAVGGTLSSIEAAEKKLVEKAVDILPNDESEHIVLLKNSVQELQHSASVVSECLDTYKKHADEFFQIILDCRNTLLDSIRAQSNVDGGSLGYSSSLQNLGVTPP